MSGADPPAVPEFSDYAIILIMVVTIGGFLVIRRKEK
ncbi:PEF-CTERM sorting domain-containing protein [Candidatus Woesearchaeota archaeon]|nr:PEF-CTERM sorting domain-containing protein [Candidatus Woesearchaeota archaeon]